MKDEYRKLLQYLRDNKPRQFAGLVSNYPKLKEALLKRYGSTKFKDVRSKVYLTKSSKKRSLISIVHDISFKSLIKWISKNPDPKLIKVATSRLKSKNIPQALTKEDYVLWKAHLTKVDRCKCGKLKRKDQLVCNICSKINKAQETVKYKYGVDNVSQLDEVKQKKVSTWKKNESKWLAKQKETVKRKYGVDNVSQIESVRQRKSELLKQSRLDFEKFIQQMNYNFYKFGKFNYKNNFENDVFERLRSSNNPYLTYLEILYEKLQVSDTCELLTSKDEFIKQLNPRIVKVKCKECGRISEFRIWDTGDKFLSCKYCNAYTSLGERYLYDWLTKHGFNVLKHYNRGTNEGELDLFISELNFAIEFQGLVWHANEDAYQRDKAKWYHYTQKGIRLFYIYEDDWNLRRDVVLSMLAHKLKLKDFQETVYARKCQVELLDHATDEVKEFFNNSHIHGFAPGSKYALLTYNGDIVAGMIIGSNRFSKNKNELEIIRFCTKPFTHVPGAFSKLITYINLKESIIFFVDSAFGSNLYDDIKQRYSYLKPRHIQLLEDSFWVVDLDHPYRKFHRLYASKDSLKRFININDDLTLDDMMKLANFGKLFRPPSWKLVI